MWSAAGRRQLNDSSSSPLHRMPRTYKTVSRCTTEVVQGTHEFEIIGYSLNKGLTVGSLIRSGIFAVGGYEWSILYYPCGHTEDSRNYISIYLELMSKSTQVRAWCDLKLVDWDTGLPVSLYQEAARIFNSNENSRFAPQISKFIRRSNLESSAYIKGDRLTIECVVTVVKEPQVSETTVAVDIEVPPSELSEHYGKLLDEKEGADVTFIVAGESFTAHKIVLAARSPVFKAELYGPMRERRARRISIDDMQPAVFRALLYFIYTDSLPAMDDLDGDDKNEMLRHLLVAADRYNMERLKLICERDLYRSLDVETVATTLALADQHHCNRLKDACIDFITSSGRMEDVMASQGYRSLKRTCPSVLVDAWEKASRFLKI